MSASECFADELAKAVHVADVPDADIRGLSQSLVIVKDSPPAVSPFQLAPLPPPWGSRLRAKGVAGAFRSLPMRC
jgi:hypothetical protein